MSTPPRRLNRPSLRPLRAAWGRALRCLAPPVLVAASAGRAEAQSACGAGTLADYLIPDFACRLGGWTASNFSSLLGTNVGGGAEARTADAGAVRLTPFLGRDAAGRPTFGFDVAGLATAAGAHGAAGGPEQTRAFAFASFSFFLDGGALGPRLVGAQVGGVFDGANATPGALRAGSTFGGSVFQLAGAVADCRVDLSANSRQPGGLARTVGGDCTTPLAGLIGVSMSVSSSADGFLPDPSAVDGFASGALTRLAFTQAAPAVVPEPATVALVAGGVLGLAVLGRARRRPERDGDPRDGDPRGRFTAT